MYKNAWIILKDSHRIKLTNMVKIKACYSYNLQDGSSIAETEIILPLQTPIEEIVHVLLLQNNLPIYKDKGKITSQLHF